MPFEGITGERMRKALLVTIVLLGLFLSVTTISGLMGLRFIGTGIAPTNTIAVTGHGEMLAVPDVATFTFSVMSQKATVAEAQSDATAKANAVTDYLTAQKIDKKDIQTTDYSVNPQYEYQDASCPQTSGSATQNAPIYCPPGKQVLKGYEVRQTTTIKVHDTAKAGDLLAGVGSKGATEVSGLNFTFDNPTGVQDQARDKAIADAKKKADTLAASLGVTLVRVVAFSENGAGVEPRPMAYGAQAMDSKVAAPEISPGQNKVTNDVSITYEIR
jgi:uncharacterized protein YggE